MKKPKAPEAPVALSIAPGFSLPLEFAARTTAILAQKGAGKTYLAMLLTEQLLAAGVQVVCFDPTGVWWGLRSSADGKRPGFPVIVFGGDHGDVPLEPSAGALVADFVAESGRSVVLDLSTLETNEEQDRFATAFAERIYRAKAAQRHTLHLMIDEADAFAPETPQKNQRAMLHAFEVIVRRGRSRGLGACMITQRAAVLSKNVLTQADLLVAMRVTGRQDFDTLKKWTDMYATPAQAREFLAALPTLEREAFFWSPGWLSLFRREQISTPRVTFDSSRTPEPGQVIAAPKLAEVDLEALGAQIAATIEKQKGNDPAELRRRIAEREKALEELRRQVEQLKREHAPAIDARTFDEIERDFWQYMAAASKAIDQSGASFGRMCGELVKLRNGAPAPSPSPAPVATLGRTASAIDREMAERFGRDARPVPPPAPMHEGHKMPKAMVAILQALALYDPQPIERTRLAILTGYSAGGGGFGNALGSLRTQGWIRGSDPVELTDAGRDVVRQRIGKPPRLPTGAELVAYWMNHKAIGKAGRAILAALSQAPGGRMERDALALAAGYEPSGGGFGNALGQLRTLKVVEGSREIALAPDLVG